MEGFGFAAGADFGGAGFAGVTAPGCRPWLAPLAGAPPAPFDAGRFGWGRCGWRFALAIVYSRCLLWDYSADEAACGDGWVAMSPPSEMTSVISASTSNSPAASRSARSRSLTQRKNAALSATR